MTTGAGGAVTGAEVAGGDVTGAEGADVTGGAEVCPVFEPFDADDAGATPEEALAAVAPDGAPTVFAAPGDAAAGGAPATGTAAGSTAAPATVEVESATLPAGPVTLNSTVGGDDDPVCWPLNARAATMAEVAAKLRPAVRAREAGAFVRFFFACDFEAVGVWVGMRSVIFAYSFMVIARFALVLRARGCGRARCRRRGGRGNNLRRGRSASGG